MKANDRNRENVTTIEDIRRIVSLAPALRVMCVAHQLRVREQNLTVTRPPQQPGQIDFTGREPFGFVFTEDNDATFHVPSGHRFVIEQLSVSSPANQHFEVQLVTKSRHVFRILTVSDWPEHSSCGETARTTSVAPIQVCGSSASTFLFSGGELHRSSTVPPDSYVQVWGTWSRRAMKRVFDAKFGGWRT
jgi:hypothetical protein